MKILLANVTRTWGGGEHWHLETARCLRLRGIDCRLLVHPHSVLAARAEALGLPLFRIAVGRRSALDFRVRRKLRKLLREFEPDCALLNGPFELKALAPPLRATPRTAIVYRRGSAGPIRPSLWNRWLFAKALDAVIVNSRATEEAVLGTRPPLIDRSRVHILHNPVRLPLQRDGLPKNRDLSRPLCLGTVGRLVPLKGIHHLIEMSAILHGEGFDHELVIVGGGPERAALEALARQRAGDWVRFVGEAAEVTPWLETFDLFVYASQSEGFGFAVAEAAAMGLPVVAFSAASLLEVTKPGVSALLVPGANPKALAEAVRELAADSQRREAFGVAGREHVRQCFDPERQLDRLMAILEDVCLRRRQRVDEEERHLA